MARISDKDKKIRRAFAEAIAKAKREGADFEDGPCDCGHSRDDHAYTPRCGGSIACTVCTCNNYNEKA